MSPRSLAEHGIEWDEDGAPVGFQIGRAAAIQDWRFRKEQDAAAFKRLVDCLESKRWRARNPGKARATRTKRDRERRATDQAYQGRERARTLERSRKRSESRRAAAVRRCIRAGCGQELYQGDDKPRSGRPKLLCSEACRSAHYRALERADPVKGPIARAKELEAQKRRKAARQAKAKECR